MSSVTFASKDFTDFLIVLHDVSLEVQAYSCKKKIINEQKKIHHSSNSENYSLKDFYSKIEKLVKNQHLLIYESAKRTNQTEVGVMAVEKWQSYLDKKVVKLVNSEYSRQCEKELFVPDPSRLMKGSEIASKIIKKINAEILWPKTNTPERDFKILLNGIKKLLSEEIVFSHFHDREHLKEVPKHVHKFLGNLELNFDEEYLVELYAELQTRISIPTEENRERITNEHVKMILTRFSNLEMLDLSGCKKISSEGFSTGHPNLKKIILTGTPIPSSKLKAQGFVKIETIIQEQLLNAVSIDDLLFAEPEIIEKQFEFAEVLHCQASTFETLFIQLEMNPSAKLVHFSVCLIQNLSKLSISKSQNDHVRKLIFKSLFDILRRADIKEWEDENSIQNVLFEKIILLHRSQDNQDIIDNFLKEELTLMRKKGTNPFESLHVPSSSDIQRVRYILKRYPKKDLKKIIDQELIKKIIHSIDIILNTLSFQKYFHTTGLGNKDPYIAALEHQFSVYVELSYIDPSNSPTPFDLLPKLLDIGKQKKSKTRIIFEKIFIRNRRTEEDFISKFNDTRAQIIACLFTAKAGTDMHLEPYYEKFLEIFTTRSRRSVYYPISKTLLGTLNENEIPTWDHSSPLTNRLLKHKIFFSKDITIQTKYKFWSNLCEGNLEGKSTILIDALRVTYGNLLHIKNDQNNKNYQNWLTKEKILRELEKIGEVEYSGPSSGKLFGNPIVEDQTTMYARTTLEVIKNYRNVSLKDKNP